MTYNEALANLSAAIPSLSAKWAETANSLLSQAVANAEYGNQCLSPNQWALVRKLGTPRTATPAANVGDFSGVIALFQASARKFPKLHFKLDDGRPVCLALAGQQSSQPGTVTVTDGGRYGENVWYGRVTPAGAWQPSRQADAATMTAIGALLSGLAANPQAFVADYGRRTGNCCFCCQLLTDQRSVTAGYGPICAAKWGLPWGA